MRPKTPKTLSFRIFVTVAIVLAAVIVVVAVHSERRATEYHLREAEHRLQTAARLLRSDAWSVLAGEGSAETFYLAHAPAARDTELRVTLIDPEGEVVVDTEAPLPLENHGGRPEVVHARQVGEGVAERRSASTGHETYYLAVRMQDGDGEYLGVLRVATRLSALERDIRDLHRALVLTALVALALGLVGSASVARYLARPLERIQASAEDVAAGRPGRQIRVEGPLEVERLATAINTMSRDLQARFEKMNHQRSEIEAILGSMSEGVVAVDADERVLLMNDAAAKLLGLGAPLSAGEEVWRQIRFPELERALRRVLDGAPQWRGDATSPHGDGRVLTVSASPVKPGRGAVAILTDVTSIRRLEQVRIDFVANVSHEMRTPLAAVLGAIETLEDPGATAEDSRRFLGLARRNAERMRNIVTDLLELSHIETDDDRAQLEPTSLELPVRASAGALAGEAEAKGVKMTVHRSPENPLVILGSDKRLEQIFTNLIGNAIKYTPKGGEITVRFLPGPREIVVEVIDTGIGIPKEALPRVFERFYRVDKARSREMGGTGLGLAIVKHATRVHGGRVEVESEEGRGTTFRVILPRYNEADDGAAAEDE